MNGFTVDCRLTQNRSHITLIDQFRYIKIQLQTKDITTRLRGINHINPYYHSSKPRSDVFCFKLACRTGVIFCVFEAGARGAKGERGARLARFSPLALRARLPRSPETLKKITPVLQASHGQLFRPSLDSSACHSQAGSHIRSSTPPLYYQGG